MFRILLALISPDVSNLFSEKIPIHYRCSAGKRPTVSPGAGDRALCQTFQYTGAGGDEHGVNGQNECFSHLNRQGAASSLPGSREVLMAVAVLGFVVPSDVPAMWFYIHVQCFQVTELYSVKALQHLVFQLSTDWWRTTMPAPTD